MAPWLLHGCLFHFTSFSPRIHAQTYNRYELINKKVFSFRKKKGKKYKKKIPMKLTTDFTIAFEF